MSLDGSTTLRSHGPGAPVNPTGGAAGLYRMHRHYGEAGTGGRAKGHISTPSLAITALAAKFSVRPLFGRAGRNMVRYEA